MTRVKAAANWKPASSKHGQIERHQGDTYSGQSDKILSNLENFTGAQNGHHGAKAHGARSTSPNNWSWATGEAGQSLLADLQAAAAALGSTARQNPVQQEGIQREISAQVCWLPHALHRCLSKGMCPIHTPTVWPVASFVFILCFHTSTAPEAVVTQTVRGKTCSNRAASVHTLNDVQLYTIVMLSARERDSALLLPFSLTQDSETTTAASIVVFRRCTVNFCVTPRGLPPSGRCTVSGCCYRRCRWCHSSARPQMLQLQQFRTLLKPRSFSAQCCKLLLGWRPLTHHHQRTLVPSPLQRSLVQPIHPRIQYCGP